MGKTDRKFQKWFPKKKFGRENWSKMAEFLMEIVMEKPGPNFQ